MFNLFKFRKGKGLGLALGGGSIRGIAHVGVLKVFEEQHIPVGCISGTSAGAIVAALYAAGLTVAEIRAVVFQLDWLHVIRPQFGSLGFFTSKRIEQIMTEYLPVRYFGKTRIPLAIAASDLLSGREYVFHRRHESIPLAVRASCSIPGLFSPVIYNNLHLVDGCLLNNVPVSLLKRYNPRHIVAVNVVPSSAMIVPPKDLVSVITRVNDLYQLAALSEACRGADAVLNPITEYLPIIKQSRQIYEQLEAMGEREARRWLSTIKRYV
jgi:NTE family protein